MTASKQVIFSTQGQWSDFVFDQVVIHFKTTVFQHTDRFVPLSDGISNGITHWTFGEHSYSLFIEPFFKPFKNGTGVLIAIFMALLAGHITTLCFNII